MHDDGYPKELLCALIKSFLCCVVMSETKKVFELTFYRLANFELRLRFNKYRAKNIFAIVSLVNYY